MADRPLTAAVVEEDATLARLLDVGLRADGWCVARVQPGRSLRSVIEARPDVLVVDAVAHSPALDLGQLRAGLPGVPTLFLVAPGASYGEWGDQTAHGDDFLAKSFSLAEAARRLRVVSRRAGVAHEDNDPMVRVGELTVDEDSREVRRAGDEIHLGPREFELLVSLARHRRRVLSKAELLSRVWEYDFQTRYNVVECTMRNLRRQVDAGRAPMIRTVRGRGYILRSD